MSQESGRSRLPAPLDVDDKNAIYDAMFAQGCREFAERQPRGELVGDLRADLATIGRFALEFCVEDPVRFQLLFQRTIPGFEPSEASMAISIASLAEVATHLASLGIDDPRDLDLFTALGMGLASQQLSNDPGGGRWVRLVDDAVDMYVAHVSRRVGAAGRAGRDDG